MARTFSYLTGRRRAADRAPVARWWRRARRTALVSPAAARAAAGGAPRTKRQHTTAPTAAAAASPITRRAIDNAITPTTSTKRRALGDTMPIKRRPKINQTGLRASDAGRLSGAPASGNNPFAAVIEACGQAGHAYHPDNALRVIDSYEGMPELVDAISQMFTVIAGKNREEFYLYPAAAEFSDALGAQFQRYRGACEDARDAFERAHAEDLEKLRNPKPNQHKWDLSLNRD